MAAGPSAGPGSKSPVKIFANIFISFIGAGVLGLPFAFKEAGILEGVLIMVFVGLISVKAMLLLIDCKYKLIQKSASPSNASNGNALKVKVMTTNGTAEEKQDLVAMEANGDVAMQVEEPSIPAAPGQDLSYGDVGYYALGNTGRYLVDATIVVSQIGFCCAYLIFISENLSDYITGLSLIHWLAILLPPLALLTFLRHLSSLAISSLFAQLSNLLAFAVVFWFDLEHFSHIKIHPKEMSLAGFPFFLAVAMYCYEGAGMILSLESSLAQEIRHRFKFFFKITMLLVTSLYVSFGVCGYLSFGPATNQIITLNLPVGYGLDFAMVVKSCLCLALFFTYPVMMFPVIKLLEAKCIKDAEKNILKGNMLRVVMVLVTGLTVMAIPDFANILGLVGSTCCTLLAFILPGLFHMKIYKGSLTVWSFCLDLFLIVLGVVGGILGTLDALQRLQAAHLESTEPVITNFTAPFHSPDTQSHVTDFNLTTTPALSDALLNAVSGILDSAKKSTR